MKLISFDIRDCNFLIVSEERYFVFQVPGGLQVLVSDLCPHRGGPLHLAQKKNNCIICPWHETKVLTSFLVKHAVPAVRNGKRMTVVIDVPDTANVMFFCKTILVNQM